jgi:hypothetical protein
LSSSLDAKAVYESGVYTTLGRILPGKEMMKIRLLNSSVNDRPFANLFHKSVTGKEPKELFTRKLSCFGDSEGKSRTIAILDYWSQTALAPLHAKLMKLLSVIDEDCTFNQGS